MSSRRRSSCSPGDGVFILAGDAQGREGYRQELEQLIAGLSGRVKLVGHCADMPAAFALAQVAVVASTEPETFGRTSIEAQAMGCPVIVTDIGAAPETVVPVSSDRQAFTGWVVPCRDPAAIAKRIAEAVALSPEARAKLSERAQRHVAANFTLGQMQRATLSVYDELLGTSLAARFEQRAKPFPASSSS